MGIELERKIGRSKHSVSGDAMTKNTAEMLKSEDIEIILKDLGVVKILGRRLRYFTDSVVIGSKGFVNEVLVSAQERFGEKRKDGARKLRRYAASLAGVLWSVRDLRRGIGDRWMV